MEMKNHFLNRKCIKCNSILDINNWNKSFKKHQKYICIICNRKEAKIYHIINRKKRLKYGKKYKLINKEEIKQKRIIYLQSNKNKVNQWTKNWRKNNPEKVKLSNSKSHAKRRNIKTEIILNKRFSNSNLHHITNGIAIYIPEQIHKSIYHSLIQNKNMDKINKKVIWWINENEKQIFL